MMFESLFGPIRTSPLNVTNLHNETLTGFVDLPLEFSRNRPPSCRRTTDAYACGANANDLPVTHRVGLDRPQDH